MSKLELQGSQSAVKGRLKQKYGNLADDNAKVAEGKEAELTGLLQQEPGGATDEARDEIAYL